MDSQVKIFDTTLRDGEQSPGVNLNKEEKLIIARQLVRLNVDVIEAGFPIASDGDFQAVHAIAREIEGPVITGLARAEQADIEAAAQAIQPAERGRIHVFVSTSDIHLQAQMKADKKTILDLAARSVYQAAGYCNDIEFSPMDATRSDHDFMLEVCLKAIENGATLINLPDTVGWATPHEYWQLFKDFRDAIPEEIQLSAHCHNDLGLAVANSLAAIEAGATQVECSVNGIGERAGNASLEELVMALKSREDVYGKHTQINIAEIARTSDLVASYTGYPIPANKAIVGRNAFSHESGIHQDGVLKDPSTYEIMNPDSLGVKAEQLFLGKHSGRHALEKAYQDLGYQLDREQLNVLFKQFKTLADQKKQVTSKDLEALLGDSLREDFNWELDYFSVKSSSAADPRAEVILSREGASISGTSNGDGAIDAIFQAINQAFDFDDIQLEDYTVNSVSQGQDALAQVSVTISLSPTSKKYRGLASHNDTARASAIAYLRAINSAC
jgi:2-isopropylmalate synthase